MSLTVQDLRTVQELVARVAGIVLDDGKDYLVTSRLGPLATAAGVSVAEYIARLRSPRPVPEHLAVVDALTTNETSFFRDSHPFHALRDELLPSLVAARAISRRLRILCLASSTGQEPYSIAMLLHEHFPQLRDWDVQITGTDLSPTALAKARSGVFTQTEVNRGLPVKLLLTHFTQDGASFALSPEIRNMVTFREMNLIEPWPWLPPQDVVMVRNVLIYFDLPHRQHVLRAAHQVLAPDGALFLGASETLLGVDVDLVGTRAGAARCYRPRARERALGVPS